MGNEGGKQPLQFSVEKKYELLMGENILCEVDKTQAIANGQI